MRADEGIWFFFREEKLPIDMVSKKWKNAKPQLKIYQFIEWIDLEFSWDIPHMNSEMDRPSSRHNNS